MTPSGMRRVLNDAMSIYFADATLASAFVARWCVGSKAETAGGVLRTKSEIIPHARAKKLPRAAECLVYSLTPSRVLAENHPKDRGFVGILRG